MSEETIAMWERWWLDCVKHFEHCPSQVQRGRVIGCNFCKAFQAFRAQHDPAVTS